MEDNRGEAIRVQRVVVVDVATGIDIPGIIRIAAISRTQTDILRFNLRPMLFYDSVFKYLFVSDVCHFAIKVLASMTSSDQYSAFFPFKWNRDLASPMEARRSLQSRIASICRRLLYFQWVCFVTLILLAFQTFL